jgi:hypothetical protein
MFKMFKLFNRFAEPVLSKVEGFKSLKNGSVPDVPAVSWRPLRRAQDMLCERNDFFVCFVVKESRRHFDFREFSKRRNEPAYFPLTPKRLSLYKNARCKELTKWMCGIDFVLSRSSLVINRSTRAWAAQAS